MKKAILVFAHKDPQYLDLFIDQLLYNTDGQTDIFIHMDKNHDELVKEIAKREHLELIKNNIPIQWGNDSMVHALVNCFNEIVGLKRKYDYFLITTGQDILVKQGLDEFLQDNFGKIFMEIKPVYPAQLAFIKHKLPRFMCKSLGGKSDPRRILRALYWRFLSTGFIPNKSINYDINSVDFWCSFNWSAMPFEVLLYMTNFFIENPGFLDIYKDTYVPEDLFLGTIIMNSPYKDSIMYNGDKSFTLTYWKDFHHAHMINLSMDDTKEIDSSKCFFARKADLKNQLEFVKYYYHKTTGKSIQ